MRRNHIKEKPGEMALCKSDRNGGHNSFSLPPKCTLLSASSSELGVRPRGWGITLARMNTFWTFTLGGGEGWAEQREMKEIWNIKKRALKKKKIFYSLIIFFHNTRTQGPLSWLEKNVQDRHTKRCFSMQGNHLHNGGAGHERKWLWKPQWDRWMEGRLADNDC